jgi:hypothetical protein
MGQDAAKEPRLVGFGAVGRRGAVERKVRERHVVNPPLRALLEERHELREQVPDQERRQIEIAILAILAIRAILSSCVSLWPRSASERMAVLLLLLLPAPPACACVGAANASFIARNPSSR